jgi:hypothetical protein
MARLFRVILLGAGALVIGVAFVRYQIAKYDAVGIALENHLAAFNAAKERAAIEFYATLGAGLLIVVLGGVLTIISVVRRRKAPQGAGTKAEKESSPKG